jgi:hypothetical protein
VRSPSARRGRAIGIWLFWSLAVFVVGMSSFSIIPSLYFPSAAPRPPAVAQCAGRLDALERELAQRSAEQLRARDTTHPPRWLMAWDDEMSQLTGTCGALEGVRQDLAEARRGLGRLLDGYAQEIAVPQRRVRQAIDHATHAPSSNATGRSQRLAPPPG